MSYSCTGQQIRAAAQGERYSGRVSCCHELTRSRRLSQKQLLVSLYTKTYEHVAHLAIQHTQQAHDGELEAFDGNAKFRFHTLVGADLLSVGDVLEGLLKEVN